MTEFNKCNSIADRFEKEVFIIMLNGDKLDYGFKWNNLKKPEYDINVNLKDGEKLKIEVKAQRIYDNDAIWIETEQGGQPSGLSVSESDYYYIFKYPTQDQNTLTKIYYNKTENATAETGIKYTLHKIKSDVLKKIISDNPDIPVSQFNDCRKGGKNTTYIIDYKYFKNLPKSDYSKLNGSLDNNELLNLEKDSLVILPRGSKKGKIYYAENPGKTALELLADPSEIDYGYGKYHLSYEFSSSSSSEGEETSLKVYNRLKRIIDKKYKTKKEKYL
jgi:hypothetical protein